METFLQEQGMKTKFSLLTVVCCSIFNLLNHAEITPMVFAVNGRVVYAEKNIAFLQIETDVKENIQLIAVDYIKKKAIWETSSIGSIKACFGKVSESFVMIEGDQVVSRDFKSGNVIWTVNLKKIIPEETKYPNGSIPGGSFPDVKHANYFKYQILRPLADYGFIFRKSFQVSGDIMAVGEEDWIQINLKTGKVLKNVKMDLLCFTKQAALLTDRIYLHLLTKKGVQRLRNGEQMLGSLDNFYYMYNYMYNEYYYKAWKSEKDWCVFNYDNISTLPVEMKIFFPGNKKIKTVIIPKENDYQTQVVAVGDYILRFSQCARAESELKKEGGNFWIEIFNLKGKSIKRIEEPAKPYFHVHYLGKTRKGEVVFDKANVLIRYSTPQLQKIDSFALDKEVWAPSKRLTEIGGKSVVCVATEGRRSIQLDLNRSQRVLNFKFINLTDGKELWTYTRKVVYRTKKKG